MKVSVARSIVLIMGTMLMCWTRPHLATASEGAAPCADVLQRGVLHVLTINLLFSAVEDRPVRLERLAHFVRSQFEGGQPVDVLLWQEAAGGLLVHTENSAQDLQALLSEGDGLDYRLSTAYATG